MVRLQWSGRVRQWRRIKKALMNETSISVPPNSDPDTKTYILNQMLEFCLLNAGNDVYIDNPTRPPRVLFNIYIRPEFHFKIRPATQLTIIQSERPNYNRIPVITLDDEPEVITLD